MRHIYDVLLIFLISLQNNYCYAKNFQPGRWLSSKFGSLDSQTKTGLDVCSLDGGKSGSNMKSDSKKVKEYNQASSLRWWLPRIFSKPMEYNYMLLPYCISYLLVLC